MDIALELADTFFFDKVYAALLPAPPAPYDYPDLKANTTGQTFSTWQYKPATQLFSLEPSQAAYMSAWPRDHIVRQYIGCFLITWYAYTWAFPFPGGLQLTHLRAGCLVSWPTMSSPALPTSSFSTRRQRSTQSTSRTRYG
jgi:hypothetical protein